MTPVTANKPITRETGTLYRRKPIVVELHAGYLVLRLKGTQQKYPVDYQTLLEVAMKIAARSDERSRWEGL